MMSDLQQQYIDQHLGSDPKCPLCGATDWFWPPGGPWTMESIELDDTGFAPPVSYYVLICGGCGYIAQIWEAMFSRKTLDNDDTP